MANVCVDDKLNSLGRHQIRAALNHTLFKLHVGNAVHQKTTNSIGTFKHRYPMAGLIKLAARSQDQPDQNQQSPLVCLCDLTEAAVRPTRPQMRDR